MKHKKSLGHKLGDPVKDSREIIVCEQKYIYIYIKYIKTLFIKICRTLIQPGGLLYK